MNLKNILWVRNTGHIVPNAPIADNLFGLKLSDSGIITTATGNPVSIITNKAQNAISTILSYSPKQSGSGDPSPQNIRPIEGWIAGNIYQTDGTAKAYNANTTTAQGSGVNVTVLSNTAFEMENTGATQYPASKQLLSNLNLTNGKTYTIYAYIDIKTITTKDLRLGIRMANNAFVSGKQIRIYNVLPEGEDKGLIAFRFTYDSSTDNYLSLAQFKTSTNTEPLDVVLSQIKVLEDTTSDTPTITTISLGGTYYGFSVDVERGVLRVTHREKVEFTGGDEETWLLNDTTDIYQFYCQNVLVQGMSGSSCYSNIAPYGVTATNRNRYNYGCYLLFAGTVVAYQMKGSKTTFDSVSAWKQYLAEMYANGTPVCAVYELATPLELPLTPQTVALLAGNNTIWTDGDEVSITYKAKKA